MKLAKTRIIRSVAACLLLGVSFSALADMAAGITAFDRMEYEAAIAEMEPLAEAGSTSANYFLGLMHDPAYHRLPSGQFYQMEFFDIRVAIKNYQVAVEAGNPYAMHRLAELFLLIANNNWSGYVDDDVGNMTSSALALRRRAVPLLRQHIEEGDGIAAYMLAEARRDEPFFFVTMDQARKMLEVTARKHRPLEQLYLGKTYLFPRGTVVGGEGFTFDPVDAFAWFTVAAKAGNRHGSVYQVEAAEVLPIRYHKDAEELARNLLTELAESPPTEAEQTADQ